MINNLYSQKNLAAMAKAKRSFLALWIAFLAVTVLGFAALLLLSTYENRLLIKIFGCIALSLFFIAFLFFLFRFLEVKKIDAQSEYIASKPGKTGHFEIVSASCVAMTLQDGTKAKEVKAKNDKGNFIFYVMDYFDVPLKTGHHYALTIVSDYIKEIEDED